MYHFALDELEESEKELRKPKIEHMLRIMIEGNRLKDIADLVLDLAV